ncbi:MAG TPA: hypothetical protein PK367_03430 [Candidatus Paceibacterota bacterium]|nr:hypothetical protein [Candidatus Paceibacterota bacterium]
MSAKRSTKVWNRACGQTNNDANDTENNAKLKIKTKRERNMS